ncbi:MAG: protein-disulfide reductase DsbD [Pseudomonadota bacterium]
MKKISLHLLSLLLLISGPFALLQAQEEDELLDPKVAFSLSVEAEDSNTLIARWNIAEGYYLYRSKIKFQSNTPGAALDEAVLPPGKVKQDEFFGEIETYRNTIEARIPIEWLGNAASSINVTITSQGCADIGVCYPPQRQTLEVALPAAAISTPMQGLSSLSDSLGLGLGAGNENEVLTPEQAFPFDAIAVDGNTIVARWDITPGHYLYKDKFSFSLEDAEGITLGQPQLPKGEEKDDEFFGRIEVYHTPVDVTLPLLRENLDATEVTLKLKFQGCADIGICYPPQKKSLTIALPAGSASSSTVGGAVTPIKTNKASVPLSEQDSLAASLAGGNTFATIALFFGMGLLLAFTPCVFPMIPILSSIIVGQGESLTTRKAFILSLVYVLAMALTYTVAGVIAGLFGANLQAAFQNPWILSSFAAVFVVLSFSMFGFFELQLPTALQSKLAAVSNKQQGGTLAGVAIMGLLSALIVGPCVAPPLMGALIYIGQTGDAVLGGLALFALSLGMGAPLLAIGVSAGKYLPRAGGWMDAVKAVFGVMLLAVAIWMLERILPATITMLLWALLAITSAVYMGAIDTIKEGVSGWYKLWKGLGLVLLIHGGLMLIGLAGGSTDPLQPIKGVAFSGGAASQQQHLQFKTIKTVADLEREITAASAAGKTVMLDFYADWCVSCKEFDKYVFSDPQVLATLANTVSLQADVTANDESDQQLLKQFNLIGPPGIIFYNRAGEELRDYRIVGYKDASTFAAHVKQAFAP